MSPYAANTEVPVERSKAEIESTLQRYGASEFASGWDHASAKIMFAHKGRYVRFILPLPDKDAFATKTTRPGGGHQLKEVQRSPEEQHNVWEQACRQKWRALALCIKAKLEAVDADITTFEDEFMAHIVLPNGGTVSEWMTPQLAQAYASGQMPKSLLALPPGGSETSTRKRGGGGS